MPRPPGKAKRIAEDTVPGFSDLLRCKRPSKKKSYKVNKPVAREIEKNSLF